ncbi:MAG: BON domain-containing protein [Vicinamibacterales bacterium]
MKKLAGLVCAAALAVACSQTDAGLTTKVQSQFAADDVVKAYQIDVDTDGSVVTLRGEVDSPAAKMRAVEIASATEGVSNVVDELVVTATEATSGDLDVDVDTDADIDLGDDARRGAEIVKEGAEETGEALKEGAERLKEGAERVVTDDDPDSDNDGR